MAEEKKKILIHTADGDHVVAVGEHKPKQTFGAMPVKDYVAAVADPDGLLRWLGTDRAQVLFADRADIERKASAFQQLLRAWLEQV